MHQENETLAVIMPVYNEEAAIGKVLDKWMKLLDSMGISYRIHAYNDGSRDHTGEILKEAMERFPDKIVAHDKANSGHGPTILKGYCDNADANTWLFQIDSDDEMGPEEFPALWEKRGDYDFLVGIRDGRTQPLPRKVISFCSRLSVKMFYGKSIWDVNTPYRLMRSAAFAPIFRMIPPNTFAPNVIISGMAARRKFRCYEHPVPHGNRQTGEVSIKKWKLLKAAIRSFRQTICFALSHR